MLHEPSCGPLNLRLERTKCFQRHPSDRLSGLHQGRDHILPENMWSERKLLPKGNGRRNVARLRLECYFDITRTAIDVTYFFGDNISLVSEVTVERLTFSKAWENKHR